MDKYIAAIEICSSKIIGAVGRVTPQGHLYVMAVEQEPVVESVHHGIISNVEDTANRITRILANLQRRQGISPRLIKSLYVGLSGRSLRNIPKTVTRSFPEDTEITQEILDAVRDDARHSQIDSSLEVIEAIGASYRVNKMETKSPQGSMGSQLEGTFQLIAGKQIMRRHLLRVVRDKVHVDVARIVVTPLAVADMVLTEDERRLGCVLVDLGAETTTVSIYKDGALRYLSVLPMGSRNITRDITTLNMMEKRAEEIKVSSGAAIAPDAPSTINIDGVRLSDVSDLVVARSEEIVANIIEQVVYSGIPADQLPGGYIVTGGGFNLNRLSELLSRQSAKNVRRGALPPYITLEDVRCDTYGVISIVSILRVGMNPKDAECLELPQVETLPGDDGYVPEEDDDDQKSKGGRRGHRQPTQPKGPGAMARFMGRLGQIFSADDDDDDPDIQ